MQRPGEHEQHVTRDQVGATCPECGAAGLEAYPVLSEGGWFRVVKCPVCLASASRERWRRLGSIELLEDTL